MVMMADECAPTDHDAASAERMAEEIMTEDCHDTASIVIPWI